MQSLTLVRESVERCLDSILIRDGQAAVAISVGDSSSVNASTVLRARSIACRTTISLVSAADWLGMCCGLVCTEITEHVHAVVQHAQAIDAEIDRLAAAPPN